MRGWAFPAKRLLALFPHSGMMSWMSSLKLILLVLLVPFGLTATALADDKKPSLTYYYFDG